MAVKTSGKTIAEKSPARKTVSGQKILSERLARRRTDRAGISRTSGTTTGTAKSPVKKIPKAPAEKKFEKPTRPQAKKTVFRESSAKTAKKTAPKANQALPVEMEPKNHRRPLIKIPK